MTNENYVRCEICNRVPSWGDSGEARCLRAEAEQALVSFRKQVEDGILDLTQGEVIDKVLVLRNAEDEARRDCERHTVDWRAVALELRAKLAQQQRIPARAFYDTSVRMEELVELRQKLAAAGYSHTYHDFVETFSRALKDLTTFRERNGHQAEEIARQNRVIAQLSEDNRPQVEHVQRLTKVADDYNGQIARYNVLKVERDDLKTERDVYKARCTKLQQHAQIPCEWQRTVEDCERIAWLFRHDMALPTSTEGEKALGAAVLYLVELVKNGREILEHLSSSYEVRNTSGGRAVAFEGYIRRWVADANASAPPAAIPAAPPATPSSESTVWEHSHDPSRVPNCPCYDCHEAEMKRG